MIDMHLGIFIIGEIEGTFIGGIEDTNKESF